MTAKDRYTHHGLPAEQVETLGEQLALYPDLQEAHLVAKVLKHMPDCPFHVLGVVRKRGVLESNTDEKDQELVCALADCLALPVDTYVITLNQHAGLRRRIRSVTGSMVYRR